MLVNEIMNKVCEKLPNVDVKYDCILKNNSTKKEALVLKCNNESLGIIVYLKDYLADINSQKITVEQAVDDIIDTYNQNKDNNVGSLVDNVINYNSIKNKIIFTLVNYTDNKLYLENIPHTRFLDLAVIYKILLCSEKNNSASIVIRNDMLKTWQVSKDELHEQAVENTPKILPPMIKKMSDMINIDWLNGDEYIEMYIATNKDYINGAAVMLYDSFIKDFAQKNNSNLLIIPSSIHELIMIKADVGVEKQYIIDMIQEVNNTNVSKEEVLSYSLYYIDKETGNISVA